MAQRYVLGPNAAREFKRLVGKTKGVSSRDGVSDGLAFDSDYVSPFTVQWAASANSGSGAWIIWLPSDSLVSVDGETYDVTEELSEVGGDYPSGWYVLDDDMIDASSGGTLFLNVEKDESEDAGDDDKKASFSSEESEEDDAYSFAICEASVDSDTGARSVKAFVTSAIVVGGGVKSITGDTASSETIKGDVEITGKLDPDDDNTSCGITFTTVSARDAEGDDPARPPRIIAKIKGQNLTDPNECDWGAHEIKYTDASGNRVVAHVFSCDDIEIKNGVDEEDEESYKNENVVGSDYIEVGNGQNNARVVEAKILTGATQSEEADDHALLTHDTVQKIVAKKTFQNVAGTKKIEVDGPNGTVVLTDVTNSKSITLNPASIPSDCQGGAIDVHELKFKDKDQNTHKYHGLFCSDVDMTDLVPHGKLIDHVTLDPSSEAGGFNTIVFYYTDGTTTTVTIQNGLNGENGNDGQSADPPEIEVEKVDTHTYIYVDGDLQATIEDGVTPVITTSKTGKVTTIYSNGAAIGTVLDGEDGTAPIVSVERLNDTQTAIYVNGVQEAVINDGVTPVITMGEGSGTPKTYPIYSNGVMIGCVHDGADGTPEDDVTEQEFITDISFSKSGNNIIATITKKKGKIIDLQNVSTTTKTVITGTEQTVVESEEYSTSTRKFTNTRKSVIVIGSEDEDGQTVFTATPHQV